MRFAVTFAALLATGPVAAPALAQDAGGSPGSAASPAAKSAGGGVTVGADGVRRDPNGVQGISPYTEKLVEGDKAYIARDYDGALTAYTDAIKLDPKRANGHYRQGLVYAKKGDLTKADEAYMQGLRLAYKNEPVRLELLFALSQLREQQRQLNGAIAVWQEYSKLFKELEEAAKQASAEAASEGDDKSAPPEPVKGFPKTSEERQVRATAYIELEKIGQSVKKRIAQRLKEAEKKR